MKAAFAMLLLLCRALCCSAAAEPRIGSRIGIDSIGRGSATPLRLQTNTSGRASRRARRLMHDDSTACPLPGCTVPDMGAPCACLECKAGWQMWPSGCVRCGNTGCATYKANTCECTSCPPGWRLNSGACTVSEETKSLLHLPVEPPQQDSALSGWDAMYQLEVNCSGTCYLSADACEADSPEGCGLSIQRDQSMLAKSMAASWSALRFRIRPCEGASPTDPLLGSPVQILNALRETARLGLDPTAVKAVAQLGSEPRCRRWVLGLHEGLNPDAYQWVLEPAGVDSMVRIRAPGLPESCPRYLGIPADCGLGCEPQLFTTDNPTAVTAWRLQQVP